jgi:glutathione S-transferase
MILYDTPRSGNVWKVRLLAGFLGLPLRRRTLSIDRGDLRDPAFLQKVPFAQVPALDLEDGRVLPESAAILHFLARDTAWWPAHPFAQAQVLSWMSFEQERHMPPLAQLRLRLALHRDTDPGEPRILSLAAQARLALTLLEGQLAAAGSTGWLATADHPSIADLALYPYTRFAPMGASPSAPIPPLPLGWTASANGPATSRSFLGDRTWTLPQAKRRPLHEHYSLDWRCRSWKR